jgi:hypothetical protein
VPTAGAVGSGAASGPELLRPALAEAARDTGACVIAVYLRSAGAPALRLAVLGGVPWEIAMPWAQVADEAASPVADAVREGRLVWIGGPEELARHYPRLAIVVPYRFTLAAAPITTGADVWGGLVVQWPAYHPPPLPPTARVPVTRLCPRRGE